MEQEKKREGETQIQRERETERQRERERETERQRERERASVLRDIKLKRKKEIKSLGYRERINYIRTN